MFLILECWSPVFRQWNKSTGMFRWISHWYGFLILGLPVRREFIFCNHNSLYVLKSEPQFKLTFSKIFRGSVGGLKVWKEPLVCRLTFTLKISRLFPKSRLLKASKQIVICASSFPSKSAVLWTADGCTTCSDSLSLSLRSTSLRISSTDAMLDLVWIRLQQENPLDISHCGPSQHFEACTPTVSMCDGPSCKSIQSRKLDWNLGYTENIRTCYIPHERI